METTFYERKRHERLKCGERYGYQNGHITPVNNFAAEARELVVAPSRLGFAPVACVAPVLEKQAPGLGCAVSSQTRNSTRSKSNLNALDAFERPPVRSSSLRKLLGVHLGS